jgi:hypothetical protein
MPINADNQAHTGLAGPLRPVFGERQGHHGSVGTAGDEPVKPQCVGIASDLQRAGPRFPG